MAKGNAEIKAEMAKGNAEIKAEMAKGNAETKADFTATNGKVDDLKAELVELKRTRPLRLGDGLFWLLSLVLPSRCYCRLSGKLRLVVSGETSRRAVRTENHNSSPNFAMETWGQGERKYFRV
jgi:hypothetical protein